MAVSSFPSTHQVFGESRYARHQLLKNLRPYSKLANEQSFCHFSHVSNSVTCLMMGIFLNVPPGATWGRASDNHSRGRDVWKSFTLGITALSIAQWVLRDKAFHTANKTESEKRHLQCCDKQIMLARWVLAEGEMCKKKIKRKAQTNTNVKRHLPEAPSQS